MADRKPMQGDLEQLLRDASKVSPLPLVADDPRLRTFGPQFATMLLTRECEVGANAAMGLADTALELIVRALQLHEAMLAEGKAEPTFPAVPREEMDAALRECDHPHPLNGGVPVKGPKP